MELWKLIQDFPGETTCCLDGEIGVAIWPRHLDAIATEGAAAFEALGLTVLERSPNSWRAVFDLFNEFTNRPEQIICEVKAGAYEGTQSWFLQYFQGPAAKSTSAADVSGPCQTAL
ncbi:MAG: hypothetical protein ACLPSW_28080 [Roseiarcus sp.]